MNAHKSLLIVVTTLFATACSVSGSSQSPGRSHRPELTQLKPAYLVTPDEAQEWATVKDETTPALTGSPKWHEFVEFLEERLKDYGVVDITRNSWVFDRWETSDDPTRWSLTSNGKDVNVAFYGAYSGSTGPEGITAPLVYYDHDNPPASIKDKIVVVPSKPHPQPPFEQRYLETDSFIDYEFRADDETFPPIFEFVPPSVTFTFDIYYQMRQRLHQIAIEGEAAGLVIVYDMAFDRVAGLYSFPVPRHYNVPTLTLDRKAGAMVTADAKEGKTATLRLEATVEPSESYQLIGYLPGKDYGTENDEQIIMPTHTDGPSITQDNGALGILAVVKYFSRIPQADRPRTLLVFLGASHYAPGGDRSVRDKDWFSLNPDKRKPVVGVIHMEHLGEMEYKEVGDEIIPTGLAEQSYLWTRADQRLIDEAIKAVKAHGWSRVQVSAPERPGIHGRQQMRWWGVGRVARGENREGRWDVPAYGLGGNLGYYWSTRSRIDIWNKDLFLAQAATMTQLTGVLMTGPLPD